MKQKTFVTFIFLVSINISVHAQITFEKNFGGAGEEHGLTIEQTKDNGYIIIGVTEGEGINNMDIYLIRTDSTGKSLWTKKYATKSWDWAGGLQQTNDGGYMIVGVTKISRRDLDIYLFKTNSVGEIIWEKTYGDTLWNWGSTIQTTHDNGYLILGQVNNAHLYGDKYENYDIYLMKINNEGDFLWSKIIYSADEKIGNYMIPTDDKGFVIVGEVNLHGIDNNDVYLVKIDSLGNVEWEKHFGGKRYEAGHFVQQTNDGGYVVVGATESYGAGDSDMLLIKTDSKGNQLWGKTFGGAKWDWAGGVKQTTDNGLILIGTTESYGAGSNDVYLVKADSNGALLWSRTFGGSNYDAGYAVQQTRDGGYVIVGATKSMEEGNINVYLIKTNSEGNTSWKKTH